MADADDTAAQTRIGVVRAVRLGHVLLNADSPSTVAVLDRNPAA